MDFASPNALSPALYALICVASALLGLLAGLYFGLRISTKDAALLARFAVASENAVERAERALGRVAVIEETVEGQLAAVEKKRAQTRAAQQRAEQAASTPAAAPGDGEAAPPPDLSPRERRRLVGRRLRGVG